MSAIMKTDNHLRYCIPMDNQRPELDLKFYKDISPDENGESLRIFVTVFDALLEVPVIVVFTKYDQFLRNVEMHLFDYPEDYPDSDVSEAAKKQFREHYLDPLGDNVKYVRLESRFRVIYKDYILMLCVTEMHRQGGHCGDLIEKTAAALNDDIVALMLLAVQRGNLEWSVKVALNR